MSRALDKHTIAALKAGNPQAAYDSISSVLVSLPPDGLLEIEILGKEVPLPEGTYVLQDGLAVGVSKLGLVQAFLVARKMLTNYIGGTGETGTTMGTEGRSITEHSSTESAPILNEQLLAATAVILLMDPEFITAANTRKRLIQKYITFDRQRTEDIRSVLEKEKRFLDSLLTSRLHRHTKSPTLWNHRRWLVETFASTLGFYPEDVTADITNIVLMAGERHPRNYYAWCHARTILRLATQGKDNYDHLLKLIEAVKKWCFRNHTDISGWSFLFHLLDLYSGSGNSKMVESTFTEVLDMASALNLTNESVWAFLRTMAASGIVGGNSSEQFTSIGQQLLYKLVSAEQQHSTDERVLRQALDWYETFRVRS
ncbi:hypothetical protein B0T20DRAFT_440500 [Sordaria brevicollis]|uniref:Uncharacterized protein n=1 Tax=Sordaria brevicollis TaxID=83679 RepID=A0AAE0UAM6_SORBR|nr:hypothetical protein B0T20DRAFT_440500 [Sordaria brevicollis]